MAAAAVVEAAAGEEAGVGALVVAAPGPAVAVPGPAAVAPGPAAVGG